MMDFSEGTKIVLEFEARNRAVVKEVIGDMNELNNQTNKTSAATQTHTEQTEKQKDAMLKARDAIRLAHKELYAFTFIATTVVAAIKFMAQGSDELAGSLEKVGMAIKLYLNPNATGLSGWFTNMVTNLTGLITGVKQLSDSGAFDAIRGIQEPGERPLSDETLGMKRTMQTDLLKLEGDDRGALELKLFMERAKMEKQLITMKDGAEKESIRDIFNQRAELMEQERRLNALGLTSEINIRKQFLKDSVGALQGGTSQTLFKLFQGEKQSPMEILKTFTTGLNQVLADTISKSLFTAIANIGKGGPGFFATFKELFTGQGERAANAAAVSSSKYLEGISKNESESVTLLKRIASATECACRNTGAMASSMGSASSGHWEGTIEGPGTSTLGKIGAIANLVGAIAGAGKGKSGGGGAGGGGDVPTPGGGGPTWDPGTGNYSPERPAHSGGWIPAFPVGGEVPILAQPGEYVVRRPMAQKNKKLLNDINNGKEVEGGGGHVFLIKANDANSFSEMLSHPASQAQLEIQIMKKIMNNADIRRVIRDFAK